MQTGASKHAQRAGKGGTHPCAAARCTAHICSLLPSGWHSRLGSAPSSSSLTMSWLPGSFSSALAQGGLVEIGKRLTETWFETCYMVTGGPLPFIQPLAHA